MQPRTETISLKAVALTVIVCVSVGCRFAVDQAVNEVAPKIKEGMTLHAVIRSVGRKPDEIKSVLVSHPRNNSEPRETHAVWDCADGTVNAYIPGGKVEGVAATRYPR